MNMRKDEHRINDRSKRRKMSYRRRDRFPLFPRRRQFNGYNERTFSSVPRRRENRYFQERSHRNRYNAFRGDRVVEAHRNKTRSSRRNRLFPSY